MKRKIREGKKDNRREIMNETVSQSHSLSKYLSGQWWWSKKGYRLKDASSKPLKQLIIPIPLRSLYHAHTHRTTHTHRVLYLSGKQNMYISAWSSILWRKFMPVSTPCENTTQTPPHSPIRLVCSKATGTCRPVIPGAHVVTRLSVCGWLSIRRNASTLNLSYKETGNRFYRVNMMYLLILLPTW